LTKTSSNSSMVNVVTVFMVNKRPKAAPRVDRAEHKPEDSLQMPHAERSWVV
jgi:hypothetical protein